MKTFGSKSARRLSAALSLTLLMVPLAAYAKPMQIAMSDDVRNMCQQAEQLINSRRFDDAIKLLDKAGNLDPSCAEVHGYLGMAYQNSLKTSQAIDEYQKALKLNPQMSFINVNLGTCYMNMNKMDQALPYFQRYLQENPNAPDANQVRSYIQQAGVRTGQQNLRSLVEQGQSLLNQHHFNEAAAAFQQAVQVQPDFAPAHFFLGYSLAQMGQCQQAINELKTTLNLDPNTKEAILNIGSNYQSLGDMANAISWYERYLREFPNSPKSQEIHQRISGLRQQMKQQGAGASQSPQSGDYLSSAAMGGYLYRWTHSPIRVYIAPGAGIPGYQNAYNQILMQAFSMWATGSQNRFAFTLVPDASQCDIFCSWTGDPGQIAEGGRAVEGGLTKLSGQPMPNAEVSITNAKVIILTNRGGTSLDDNAMMKVCLHEVGHALGINGHSNNNQDTMFFTESPTVMPALSNRDKATITRLYSNPH